MIWPVMSRVEILALSVELLESVQAVEDDVEGAWATEIDRRAEELERGAAETIAAEDVFARYGRVF
jgi:hypothetical protein